MGFCIDEVLEVFEWFEYLCDGLPHLLLGVNILPFGRSLFGVSQVSRNFIKRFGLLARLFELLKHALKAFWRPLAIFVRLAEKRRPSDNKRAAVLFPPISESNDPPDIMDELSQCACGGGFRFSRRIK